MKFALRQLWKTPGFTAVTVLTLALGIGATTAIFTLINAVLLRELPFAGADRLVAVWAGNPGLKLGFPVLPLANAQVAAWRGRTASFERIAAFTPRTADLTGEGDPERVGAVGVTAGFFETLGIRPLLGRTLAADEEPAGGPPVVLLGHGLWRRRFGADPTVVGRRISVNGEARTVIGVLPPEFDFPRSSEWPSFFPFAARTELWLPLAYRAADDGSGNSNWASNDERGLGVLGRLRAGASLPQAQAELDTFAARDAKDHPDAFQGWQVKLISLREQLTGKSRTPLLILFAAAGLLLLIACVNVANLLLARGVARRQELAVRAALGADRGRLVRLMFVECLLLAGLGGGLGLVVAGGCVRLFLALNPASYSRLDEASLDPLVVAFTVLTALVTCVASGVIPALRMPRFDLRKTLHEAGRGVEGPALGSLRGGFVAAQVALALVLLVLAGLMVRSFLRLQEVQPGFRADSVLAFDLQLPQARYPQEADGVRFFEQLTTRLQALPGVTAAGAISYLPLGGGENMGSFTIEGQAPPASGYEQGAERRWVTAGYFAALGIPVRQGRVFTPGDRAGQPGVVVINEALARQYFSSGDPLGRRLKMSGGWRTVVGVVADVKSATLEGVVRPQTYLPYAQDPWPPMTVVLHTDRDPLALAAAVRGEMKALDSQLPLAKMRTMEQVVSTATGARRFSLALMGFFAVTALALTALGIYGVVAFLVGRRARELGIRMALGAQRRSILRLVLGQGLKPVLVGSVLGIGASLGAARLLANQLYGVSPADPLTLASILALLFATAFLACWLPARRAARLDPMTALRAE